MSKGLTSCSTHYTVFLCFCAFVCITDFSFQFSYHLAFAARACHAKIKAIHCLLTDVTTSVGENESVEGVCQSGFYPASHCVSCILWGNTSSFSDGGRMLRR